MDLPHCGTRHDRNLNAAINLRNLIMPSWAEAGMGGVRRPLFPSSVTCNACGTVNPGMERGRRRMRPRRGSGDHRKLIMPVNLRSLSCPQGYAGMGEVRSRAA